MARHVIPIDLPGAPEIVWDNEKGTVEGDNRAGDAIREALAQEMPLNMSGDGRILYLQDPAHDPRDFWHLLPYKCWKEPLFSRMPAILREAEPTPPKPAPLPVGVIDGVRRELIPGVEFFW